ncbi:2OG-Fe(II) oxygenase [bacterium]|nr:2OG-Fe(II) oxygenase [bacterium]
MVKLSDLIKVYDNSLEPKVCVELVNIFENLKELHERIENNKKPNFTQLNLTEVSKNDKKINSIHQLLIKKTFEYKKDYYNFIDERCFPLENTFEQFRIKKYLNDGNDTFDCHVDVTDYASARRFLSFMWYLNDVEDGGETIFNNLSIKPETGKLIVFPPLWMFPHIGKPPLSNNKYILSTYLHYK